MSATIHNVLAAACQALDVAEAEFVPDGKAIVDDPRYDDLVAWIARQAAPKLRRTERAELAKLFDLLATAKTRKLTKEEKRILSCDEDATDLSDGEIVLSGLKMYAVKGARRAGAAAARLLGRPFLEALAKELWRLDAISLLAKQKLAPKGGLESVREGLWRGATGARITHRIVRLEGEAYGLIAMTRGRWTWSEGTRDDILASVPDALMESAVEVVLGGRPKKARPPPTETTPTGGRPVVLALDDADKLLVVAMSPEGDAYVLTKRGRLGVMRAAASSFEWTPAEAAGVRGMTVSNRGAVVTWGAGVTLWRSGKATRLATTDADGAHVGPDDGVTWWSGETIVLPGKKSVRGSPYPSVAVLPSKGRVLAIGDDGTRVFDRATGKTLSELSIRGAMHAVSPDEERIATWDKGPKARVVRIFATDDGRPIAEAKLDSGAIDTAVFTNDGRIFVRYHDRIRVAVLDANGKLTHRIDARRLGTPGSTVRGVFPLSRGASLAFACYPRGEAVLVDAAATALARYFLGPLFVGGHTLFAEGGGGAILTHDHAVQRVLVL